MSKSDAFLALYVGDYLADTGHLSTLEHGAYLLLLMHSWRTGPLPDDDAMLARIARLDPAGWRRVSGVVRGFFRNEGGKLIQPRLERERVRATDITEKRRVAGKVGAAKRWQADSKCHADAKAEAEQSDRPSPSPSPIPTEAALPSAPAELPDARRVLWGEGLARLRRITGQGDRQARGLLGRMVRDAGDDCALISSLLHQAEADRVGDPVPWLQAAIRTRTGQRTPASRQSNLAWMREGFGIPDAAPAFDLDLTATEIPQ